MAYIVEVTFKDGEKEIVPLWSPAILEEMYSLTEENPDIAYYKTIVKHPTIEECKDFDKKVKRTKYILPKEFKENRRSQ